VARLFGGVAFMATWGVVISWLLLATAAAVANWLRSGSLPRTLLDTVGFALPLGVAAYLFYLPFYAAPDTPVKGLTVTEVPIAARVPLRSEVTRPLHFLLFWAPAIWAGLSFIAASVWAARREALRPLVLAAAAALWAAPVGVWTVVILSRDGVAGLTDEISARGANAVTVLMLAAFITMTGVSFIHQLRLPVRERDPSQLFALHLAGVAFLMLLGAEFFFVSDLFR